MAFYEHRFAHLMGLKPGMKVLDVGCGVGGPTREIAKFIGCEIVGISINKRQVDRARELTEEAGLSDKCVFIQGDFLVRFPGCDWYNFDHNLLTSSQNLPFAPGTFDAAYAIEATVHAPSLTEVYSGIRRVLKPNAVFGLSEWVMSPSYDPSNPAHIGVRNRIERGNGVSNLQTSDHCRQAMRDAGFDIYHDEDYALYWTSLGTSKHRPSIPGRASLPPSSSETTSIGIPPVFRPWYYPLAGQTSLCTTWADWWITIRMTPWARKICYVVIWILETLRLYPRGVCEAMTTIAYCVDSVVEGGQQDIFTPCWWFIGRNVTPDEVVAGLEREVEEGAVDSAGQEDYGKVTFDDTSERSRSRSPKKGKNGKKNQN